MVRTHLQLNINGFEKPTVLFMNYMNLFLLWPQWASERNHYVICMYAIFLGIRWIYVCFQSYSRLHFQALTWKPGRNLIIVYKSAAGQSDLSLLQLFLPFHSSIHIYPNTPFQLHIIFQAKYESKGAPVHTSVPLPCICYSCFCDVTDGLIADAADAGLVTPRLLPIIPLPTPKSPTCQVLIQ